MYSHRNINLLGAVTERAGIPRHHTDPTRKHGTNEKQRYTPILVQNF